MDVAKILVLLTLVIYAMGLLCALLKPKKVREFIRHWAPGRGGEDFIASATIEAVKPAN